MVLPVFQKLREPTLTKTQKRNLQKYRSIKMQKIENKALKIELLRKDMEVPNETPKVFPVIPNHQPIKKNNNANVSQVDVNEQNNVNNLHKYVGQLKQTVHNVTKKNQKLERKIKNVLSHSEKVQAKTVSRKARLGETRETLRKSRINVFNFNRGAYGLVSALSMINVSLKAVSVLKAKQLYMSYCQVNLNLRDLNKRVDDVDLFEVMNSWKEKPIKAYIVYMYMYYYLNLSNKTPPLYMNFHDFMIYSEFCRNHVFNLYQNYNVSYEWSQLYDTNLLALIEVICNKYGDPMLSLPGRILGHDLYIKKVASLLDWRIILDLVPFGHMMYSMFSVGKEGVNLIYDYKRLTQVELELYGRRLTNVNPLEDGTYLSKYNQASDRSIVRRSLVVDYIAYDPSTDLSKLIAGDVAFLNAKTEYVDLAKLEKLESVKNDLMKAVEKQAIKVPSSKLEILAFLSDPTHIEVVTKAVGGSFELGMLVKYVTDLLLGSKDYTKSWNQDFLWTYREDLGGFWGAYWQCNLCKENIYTPRGPARRNSMDKHAVEECPFNWDAEILNVISEMIDAFLRGQSKKQVISNQKHDEL